MSASSKTSMRSRIYQSMRTFRTLFIVHFSPHFGKIFLPERNSGYSQVTVGFVLFGNPIGIGNAQSNAELAVLQRALSHAMAVVHAMDGFIRQALNCIQSNIIVQ